MDAFRCWFFTRIATWALVFRLRDIAIDYYRKVLALRPRDALTHARIAYLLYEAGQHAEGIAGYERVVQLEPNHADHWFNLGYMRQAAGAHRDAMQAFDRAIELNEKHDRAWFGKAMSLIAVGRLDDAIDPLRRNIRLQPMSPFGFMELTRVYFRLGDRDRAEKEMRRLKEFDPKNAARLEDETGIRIGIERWWKD